MRNDLWGALLCAALCLSVPAGAADAQSVVVKPAEAAPAKQAETQETLIRIEGMCCPVVSAPRVADALKKLERVRDCRVSFGERVALITFTGAEPTEAELNAVLKDAKCKFAGVVPPEKRAAVLAELFPKNANGALPAAEASCPFDP